MISSMTGFASLETPHFTWELRSQNSRGLDLRARIPESYRRIEARVVGSLKEKLSRGTIEVRLRLLDEEDVHLDDLRLPDDVLDNLDQTLRQLPAEVDRTFEITNSIEFIRQLNRLQNRAEIQESMLLDSLKKCVDRLVEDRRREGAALANTINEKILNAEQLLRQLRQVNDEQPMRIQHRLQDRIQRLTVELEPSRLAQEVALLAQKADYSEELDRITIHLKEMLICISQSRPCGRRLEFLSQELLREANTILSKLTNPEYVRHGVNLKLVADQLREQAQNVE